MRVGLVGPLPPPAGGMATQCRQLYELLQSENLDVTLVQTNSPYRPDWMKHVRGVRACARLLPYVAALGQMCAKVDVIHLMANSGWSWHLFAAPAVWVARSHDVPLIINYRGGDAERFMAEAPRWVGATMRAAQAFIVPSDFLRKVFDRHGIDAAIIPNIIDLDLFRPSTRERSDDSTHIVVTRNLEAIYGIDDALHAFRLIVERHANARLTVAGEGPEQSALMALAKRLEISDRVCFPGRLPRTAIADLYRDADILLNPSRIDNMPNSILEAYASGIAVVSTNVGGIPYIAHDMETAVLVPPRNPSAMADGVSRLIADRTLSARLARNGLREATRYGWPRVGKEWISLYRKLQASGATLVERA